MLGYFFSFPLILWKGKFVFRGFWIPAPGGFQPAQASTKEKFDIEGIWKTRFMRSLASMDWHCRFCGVGSFLVANMSILNLTNFCNNVTRAKGFKSKGRWDITLKTWSRYSNICTVNTLYIIYRSFRRHFNHDIHCNGAKSRQTSQLKFLKPHGGSACLH